MRDRTSIAILVAQVFVISLMIALFGRLFYLQIADGPRYQAAALNIQSRDIVTPALRGLIVDITGEKLANNKAGLMVTADRSILDQQSETANLSSNEFHRYLSWTLAMFLPERDFAGSYRKSSEMVVGPEIGTNLSPSLKKLPRNKF